MNSLFLIAVFEYIFIAAIYWFMPYATPKSVQFGVRIPSDRVSDPSIADALRNFHVTYIAGSAFIFVLFIILPWLYGLNYVLFLSIAPILLFSYLNYYRINRRLRKIKDEQSWYGDATGSISAAIVEEGQEGRSYTGILSILPSVAIIALTVYIGVTLYPTLPAQIPTHFGTNGQPDRYMAKSIGSVFLLVFVQIGMTVMIALIGLAIVRTRQETDVSRPRTSYEQQIRFKLYTRDAMYLFNSMIAMTMMFSAFETWGLISGNYVVLLTVGPALAGALVLTIVLMSMGQMGSRIRVAPMEEQPTGKINRNDDRYWKGGALYYNRDDPAILVGKRFGVGWTFNFAHPVTWIVFGAIIALPVIIVSLTLLH